MKKIWAVLGLIMFVGSCQPAFAEKVNMTKPGTTWVWRVEDGLSLHFLLTEARDRFLMEDGSLIRGEETSSAMLYNALVGQGWISTDSAATIPQALIQLDEGFILQESSSGTDNKVLLENGNYLRREASADPSSAAQALDLGLLENGDFITFENGNNLRLEN